MAKHSRNSCLLCASLHRPLHRVELSHEELGQGGPSGAQEHSLILPHALCSFLKKNFCSSIVDLHCCANFFCAAEIQLYIYILFHTFIKGCQI